MSQLKTSFALIPAFECNLEHTDGIVSQKRSYERLSPIICPAHRLPTAHNQSSPLAKHFLQLPPARRLTRAMRVNIDLLASENDLTGR